MNAKRRIIVYSILVLLLALAIYYSWTVERDQIRPVRPSSAFADEYPLPIQPPAPKLENAPELARIAFELQVIDGMAHITYVYSDGTENTLGCGLDPVHVFGSTIRSSDLRVFLLARAEANRTGTGVMHGDHLASLVYVILYTVGLASDAGLVDEVAALLADPQVRPHSKLVLFKIGDQHPELRQKILTELAKEEAAHGPIRNLGEPEPGWAQQKPL